MSSQPFSPHPPPTPPRPPPPPPPSHPPTAVPPRRPPPPPPQESARKDVVEQGYDSERDEASTRPPPTNNNNNDPMLTPRMISRHTATTTTTTPLKEERTPPSSSDHGRTLWETPTTTPTTTTTTMTISSRSRRTTPLMTSQQKPFVFLSDEKAVPDGLKRLQESTRHRRRQLMTQIHHVDCHLASLTAQFAEETMDMSLAVRDTLDRSVCIPLESSVDRLMMERESSPLRGPAIVQLERHLATMEVQMTRHSHVDVIMAVRDHLDSLHNELFHDVLPRLRMEDCKSNKMEGGVIRRYENVAGVVARQFHQEAAARRASTAMLLRQTYATSETTPDDTHPDDEDLFNKVRALRERLKKEREQRRRQDMMIMDDIRRTTVAMKRALLAVVGAT